MTANRIILKKSKEKHFKTPPEHLKEFPKQNLRLIHELKAWEEYCEMDKKIFTPLLKEKLRLNILFMSMK